MDSAPAADSAPALRPRADGLLDVAGAPAFPIMAPRLQGELTPDGRLSLALWGRGEGARLKLEGLDGPLVLAPGRIGENVTTRGVDLLGLLAEFLGLLFRETLHLALDLIAQRVGLGSQRFGNYKVVLSQQHGVGVAKHIQQLEFAVTL